MIHPSLDVRYRIGQGCQIASTLRLPIPNWSFVVLDYILKHFQLLWWKCYFALQIFIETPLKMWIFIAQFFMHVQQNNKNLLNIFCKKLPKKCTCMITFYLKWVEHCKFFNSHITTYSLQCYMYNTILHVNWQFSQEQHCIIYYDEEFGKSSVSAEGDAIF